MTPTPFPEALGGAGYQLDRSAPVPSGRLKSVTSVGLGVREIGVRGETGAFRVIYIAALADAVYVLHAFHKKVQQTAKRDHGLAAGRVRQVTGRRT